MNKVGSALGGGGREGALLKKKMGEIRMFFLFTELL